MSIVALLALNQPGPRPTSTLATGSPAPSGSVGVGPELPPPPEGITFADFTVDTATVRSPTTSTAQSKLWFADGRWWGAMFGPETDRLGIFALDPATQVWADTGTLIDDRVVADTDMLWTGTHLWAVSGGSRPSANHAIRVRRFSYDADAKRYALDADFPVTVRPTGGSPAVIAVDGADTVWVAYAADGKVWVTHTLASATSWSAPVALAMPEATVDVMDVASIIAFGPGRIGVAWTNQASGVYFSTHEDGAPDDTWTPVESVLSGQHPDAQLHLATFPLGADRTAVAAAVATTHDDSAFGRALDPLTLLAVRDEVGRWVSAVVGLVRDRHARPIVLVDPTAGTIAVAATSPGAGGAVFYKRTPLDRIGFDTGIGVPLISSTTQTAIDNVTSAKGPLSPESGLLVLASDRNTGGYLHAVVDLGGGPPAADPADATRPKTPTAPPAGTTTTLARDTFDPWPVGTTVPAAWYTRPEDPEGRLTIVEEDASTRALRVIGAGAGARACRDVPEVPGTVITVRVRVRLSRIGLEDATILSARGSGGESASVRVTNKGVLAWFDRSTKIRTTKGLRAGTWYIVLARIDQSKGTYDVRVTTDGGQLITKASGLRWRQPAVETVGSVCVETAPAPPTQTIEIGDMSVIQVVTP